MAESQRTRTCSIKDCDRRHEAKGLCHKHYQRLQKHGTPHASGRVRFQSPEERFSTQTKATGSCLVWTGQVDLWGYGQMWNGTRVISAHRYAWEAAHGQIPAGMELDHKCHNRACCNLTHLRLATRKQNQENAGMRADNTSGHRGVFWDKSSKKWRARVRHHGRNHSAGSFIDILEAAEAAKSLRNELFTFNNLDREGGK